MRVVYGVGLGPGDPGLVTLRGKQVLDEAQTVYAPTGAKASRSRASEILRAVGIANEKVQSMIFPMTLNDEERRERWTQNAKRIGAALLSGQTAAFVTLGDPAIYSTWGYLSASLNEVAADIETRWIPGVTTMSAAACTLKATLLSGNDRLALIPTPDEIDQLDDVLDEFDTVVLYKVGRRLGEVSRYLADRGLDGCSYFASNVGLADERAHRGLPDPGTAAYMSTIIVRKGECAE